MSWGWFGLSIAAVLFVIVFVFARRGWNPLALSVALANWLVASLNAAAPFRAAIDPDYVGYSFGLFSAERGLAVTAVAGTLLVGGALAAVLAARQLRGFAMGFVLVFDGALAAVLGAPLAIAAATDPTGFIIEFGEYLTIPAAVAIPVMFLLIVAPLTLGAVWSAQRLSS
jgi:hypothetical protein